MRCLIISDTTTHSKYWYYKYVQLLGGRKHTSPPPLFILGGGRRPSSPPAFYASAQNTLDAETDRPVHKVNYCVAMSACNKCTNDHPCEDCSQTQTFSGLNDRDALKDFCMWAFDDKINQEAVFTAHNGSNYDSHFILSYLVENTEYP